MQAPGHPSSQSIRAPSRRGFWLVGLVLGLLRFGPARQVPVQPGQAHVAGQFLRAILRADYARAYGRLAPEVRRAVSLANFEASARPLWKIGQRHPSSLELYKLGVRLGEGSASRLFYSFSFAADSALPAPSVLLEVTFRDTTARNILSFDLRPTATMRKLPVQKSQSPPRRRK